MADIQIVKGEVANTAASLSAGSTLVMVDALQLQVLRHCMKIFLKW